MRGFPRKRRPFSNRPRRWEGHRRESPIFGCPLTPAGAKGPSASRRLRRQRRELLAVGLLHPRPDPMAGQGVSEHLPHRGILVGVIELVAAEPPADEAEQHALRVAYRAGMLEGEIARRRRAGVEMLM